jgi:hypothetical protein
MTQTVILTIFKPILVPLGSGILTIKKILDVKTNLVDIFSSVLMMVILIAARDGTATQPVKITI